MKNLEGRTLTAREHRGGPKEMIAVALPMVVSMSCDTVMVFTDRWFLSRLNENLMNAAFVGGMSAYAAQTFFVGLIGYVTALVAQELGKGSPHRSGLAGGQGILLALCAWPLMLAMIPLADHVFPLLGLPQGQIVPQTQYFNWLATGSVIGLVRGALSGFFTGIGRTKVVMVASLVAMSANVFLVWTLVFGKFGLPALGIVGAAVGTLTAGTIGLAVLVGAWLSHSVSQEFRTRSSLRFDRGLMTELVRKGSSSGAEMFLNMMAFQTITLLFQRQGEASATAASIIFSWDMVSFVPLVGIEVGTMSLVGRYVGAGDFSAVHRTLWSGMRLGWTFSAFALLAFLVFPQPLVDLFRPEGNSEVFDNARSLSVAMLRIASIYIMIEAVMLVYSGALRGAGDTFWTMCITVGLHWSLVVALWYTLEVLHAGSLVGWSVLVGVFLLFPLVLWLRWRSGHWKGLVNAQQEQPA